MAVPKFANSPQIRVDPTAAKRTLKNIILDNLATRERFRETLNLRQFKYLLLQEKVYVDDAEFINVFEQFEKMGAGKLIKGKTPVFQWTYKLNLFAKAARAGLPIPDEARLVKKIKRHGVKGRPKGSLNKTTMAKLSIKPEPETEEPKAALVKSTELNSPVVEQRRLTPAQQVLERHKARQTPVPEVDSPTLMLAVPKNIRPEDLQALMEMIEAIKASN